MIPLDEARSYVLAGCRPLEVVEVTLDHADALILAEQVVAAEAVPPFANTAMDGFAVRAADTVNAPADLRIVGTLAAGAAPDRPVEPGEAIRIMTGAPMPPGADAVIMVELTSVSADDAVVTIERAVPVGNHVRGIGEDLSVGQLVFEAGTELTPGHLGVLASLGSATVRTHRRPRVGVLSTGDELVAAGEPLAPGQIRDSNRRTLLALVGRTGCVPVDLGLVRDDEALIREAISAGAASCDALITSGGVSMGDYDYVKAVLDDLGEMRWMQVAIKPAKPLAFGLVGRTPVFGLPGNPVSSMVSFELFARPGLRTLMGHAEPGRPSVRAIADADLKRHSDGKIHFARVVVTLVDGEHRVVSAGGQGSHQLHAMATANALAVLPNGEGAQAGDSVEVLLLP